MIKMGGRQEDRQRESKIYYNKTKEEESDCRIGKKHTFSPLVCGYETMSHM